MKKRQFIYQLANSAIRCFVMAAVFILFLHSIYSTSFIGRVAREDGSTYKRTLNIPDSPWKHLLVFVLATVLCVMLSRIYRRVKGHGSISARREGRILIGLSILFFGLGALWVMLTQMKPGSDPAKVYAIALQWRAGDFSAFEEGEYLFCYPFQSGIVLFYYLLSFLFGTTSYVGPQIVNAAVLSLLYFMMAVMARSFWSKEQKLPVLVYLALMCWTPLFFFITYIYGILPGTACAVGTVYLALRYLETRRYRYMAGAALCIGLATVLKMNCLIYLVAVACFMLYDAVDILLQHKKERQKGKSWIASVGFIVLMYISVSVCNGITEYCVERLSGYDMPEGEVMVSWAVMGLQEAPKGPGDYNGYNGDVFSRNNYDTELATQQSFADLRRIIERMVENPLDEGVTFFARKTAYQWNDPTFISMERMQGRKSAIEISAPVQSLIDGKGSVALSIWLNYVQSFILLGALLYLILNWNSRNLYELVGAVVFLGGYLFHMVWEANSSYTIPYFTMMIPYAVKGFYDWVKMADQVIAGRRISLRLNKKAVVSFIGAAVAALVVVGFLRTNLFHRTIALDDGAEAVSQYYHREEE